MGASERFKKQLLDAVTTLRVGMPDNPDSVMGPIIEPPGAKLQAGLGELEKGERWLLEPKPLDDSGRVWSPGIREGVRAGSPFHLTEYFGPVLGIMHVGSLDEAIAVQNGVDYGLTAGIHSLNPDEVSSWLARVQAGNCYVNRGITGAIVQRQPFGGWKKSSVGPGTKAGGPNYLFALGHWRRRDSLEPSDGPTHEFARDVLNALAEEGVGSGDFVKKSLASDESVWRNVYGASADASGLGVERNILRYVPHPVVIRATGFVPLEETVRVVMAGLRAGATVHLSTSEKLPDSILDLIRNTPVDFGRCEAMVVESEREFVSRMSSQLPSRIRLLGSRADAMAVALDGAPEVAIYADDVTESGRVEMLPFVREQAVSITAHRFGAPDPRFVQLVV